MATTTVYLSGNSYWAKLKTPDSKYNQWTLQLVLDNKSLKVYHESGMGISLKKNDKGETYVNLRRPVSKLIKGDLVKFDPPTLLDKDNQPIDLLIGNGSKVVCKVVVYDTMKGKGHRLEAVRVEDLVHYEKNDVVGDIDLPF